MKKMKKWLAVFAAILLLAAQAQAQEIVFTGEACPLPIAEKPGEEPVEIACTGIDLFRMDEDGNLLVVYGEDDTFGYITREAFEELVPIVDLTPYENSMRPDSIGGKSDAEDAIYLQQLLCDGGYIEDKYVDGMFGPKSKNALKAFQKEAGLKQTDAANLMTQYQLEKKIHGGEPIELAYPIQLTPEVAFPNIYQKTAADLSVFASMAWKRTYDVFTGTGRIDPALPIADFEENSVPIDRIAIQARLAVEIDGGLTSEATLYPVLVASASGAYGAYMQSVTLMRGDTVATAELFSSNRSLNGAEVCEETSFHLNEEALELLGNAELGELHLRVNGQNKTYDLNVTAADADFADFAANCKAAGLVEE